MVDAQLDEVQQEALHIDFDPSDVPQDRFLPGGKAWQLCRSGQANPEHFGIFDMHGLRFIRGNLVRDLASLNKMELLPWDCWGLIDRKDQDISEEDLIFLDRVADLTIAGNDAFSEMHSLYESDGRVRVPPLIKSYTKAGVKNVSLLDR